MPELAMTAAHSNDSPTVPLQHSDQLPDLHPVSLAAVLSWVDQNSSTKDQQTEDRTSPGIEEFVYAPVCD
jgi:hypothetical protein